MSTKTGTVRTTRRRRSAADRDDPPGPTSPSLTEALPRLAAALDDAAEHAGWGRPPALVRVTAWPAKPTTAELDDGFDLGVRPLEDGMSVVDALSGFTAPAGWLALGVVTEGNARHLVEPTAEPRRVRCVHLVDRSGASASTLRVQGEEQTLLTSDDEREPHGRVSDVCRRALGLATAPPAGSTAELWALVWLDRIFSSRAACDPGTPARWRRIAELHPAVGLLVHDDERWSGEAADNLPRLGELLSEIHNWSVLRRACAAGDWPVEDVSPMVAEWLDDGCFSRWVLGGFPPIDQLVAAVTSVLPPSVARRVRAALRAWQLPLERKPG